MILSSRLGSATPKLAFSPVEVTLTLLMFDPVQSRLLCRKPGEVEEELHGPRHPIFRASRQPKTAIGIEPIKPASASPADQSGFGNGSIRIVPLALGRGVGNYGECIPIVYAARPPGGTPALMRMGKLHSAIVS
jgi:hypothetical protein